MPCGASWISLGKPGEKPPSFEQQSLRASRRPLSSLAAKWTSSCPRVAQSVAVFDRDLRTFQQLPRVSFKLSSNRKSINGAPSSRRSGSRSIKGANRSAGDEAMTDKNRIMICGPKDDGTYLVIKTAAGRRWRSQCRGAKRFQADRASCGGAGCVAHDVAQAGRLGA